MNLTSYSSSESADEEHSYHRDVDYFNLKPTSSNKELSVKKTNSNNVLKGDLLNEFGPGKFWSDFTQEENWVDEQSIWGVVSERFTVPVNVPKEPFKRKNCDVMGYMPKRFRCDKSHENQKTIADPIQQIAADNCKSSNNRIELSIHPYIKPNLRKLARNNLPKTLMTSLRFSSKSLNRISWCSPNFSHLILSASADGCVRVMDVFSETCPLTIASHQKSVKDAAWSPCGHYIASCGFDKHLILSNVESGSQIFSSSHDHFLTCTKFAPNDSNLVVTGSFNVLLGWDIRVPKTPIRKYKHKDRLGQILDICFLSDTEFASTCDFVSRDSADRCIMIWDFQSSASISNEIFHEKYTCPRLSGHPFRKEFVAQTQGNYIAQFSSEPPYRMNKHKQYNNHKVSGYSVGCDVNPGGNIIASGNSDGQVVFYNYQTTDVMTRIGNPHTGDIALDVAWHPVLRATCAYSTWDGRVDVWK